MLNLPSILSPWLFPLGSDVTIIKSFFSIHPERFYLCRYTHLYLNMYNISVCVIKAVVHKLFNT